MKRAVLGALLCLASGAALADVTITDHDTLAHGLRAKDVSHALKAGDKPGFRMSQVTPRPNASGAISLVDASGLKYFINTNIDFATTSSNSGAMSEASYTHAVAATTSMGGTTASTLNDAFDGYNSICLSTTATGPCVTSGGGKPTVIAGTPPVYTFYNDNGPATIDTSVPATAQCTGRQVAFPVQNIEGLNVSRKVFVPTDDTYSRSLDILSNPTGAPITVNLITSNNMGSDNNTIVFGTASGDTTADTSDTWVGTFQNFSGNSSSDPRIGHVLQGPGAPVPVSAIHFADGDDNPFWSYNITVPAGGTRSILRFVTGQPSRAAAASNAARLVGLPASATECLSLTEQSQVANFVAGAQADLGIALTLPPGQVINGTLATFGGTLSNAGPTAASGVTATITFPAGYVVQAVSAIGYNCSAAANVATCTAPNVPVGNAALGITVLPPASGGGAGTVTGTISGTSIDPVPANNTATVTINLVTPQGPPAPVPAIGGIGLLGLIGAFALMPYFLRRRRAAR